MLPRVLEPELMDTPEDARDYDTMDHSAVNRVFTADFFSFCPRPTGTVLDVGTGTAQIPIELCRTATGFELLAIDAAGHMLAVAAENVARAGLGDRIRLENANARRLPYPNASFPAVVSNSIVHHIPDPFEAVSEMARVCAAGGVVFVRDLVRPPDERALRRLVNLYAAGANDHQRKLFADSLRAALTLSEVQTLVAQLGYAPATVRQTSDRHWTWAGLAG
jgi:ubiquinone/menaquinone biosynthesis C-methylase UbiE